MNMWIALLIIFFAGAIGGVVNAIMTNNGFIMPKPEDSGGVRIFRPGFLGNIIVSGVAACISWGLYGSFSSYTLWGQNSASAADPNVTLAAFVGAILVGVAGARWLTNEVDKSLLRATAVEAATSQPNKQLAAEIAVAAPAEAFKRARQARNAA